MNTPLILSQRICARTSPCPKSCPRYYVTRDKAECARQLLEAAAHTLHGCERKHSEWVWREDLVGGQNRLRCQECDKECMSKNNYYVESKYCPHCGAIMDKEVT